MYKIAENQLWRQKYTKKEGVSKEQARLNIYMLNNADHSQISELYSVLKNRYISTCTSGSVVLGHSYTKMKL